jgi:hypothetical protein
MLTLPQPAHEKIAPALVLPPGFFFIIVFFNFFSDVHLLALGGSRAALTTPL